MSSEPSESLPRDSRVRDNQHLVLVHSSNTSTKRFILTEERLGDSWRECLTSVCFFDSDFVFKNAHSLTETDIENNYTTKCSLSQIGLLSCQRDCPDVTDSFRVLCGEGLAERAMENLQAGLELLNLG